MAIIETSTGEQPWNKVRPQTKPPEGYDWYPVYNADETQVVGWKLKKLTTPKTDDPGPGGTRYVYSGGGGGGGGLSSYIQRYRMMFGDPNAKPPKALLQKAKDGNWSDAYWQFMVRQKDPKYFRSAEAKQKTADLSQYMKAIGIGMDKSFTKQYLREGWSMTQLQNKVTSLKEFKQKYQHYGAFEKAQIRQGAAKQVNPLAYRAYQETFRNAFKQAGYEAPEGWERTFFKSGVSDENFLQNFSVLGQTRAASTWDTGGLNQQQQKSVMFSGKGSAQLRTQLQQALAKQQRYFKQAADSFGVGQQSGLIQMKGL